MDEKLRQFLQTFCLTPGISYQSKVDRSYAVLQYLVSTNQLAAVDAEHILDKIKAEESI